MGPGQPAGLGDLRVGAARHVVARLHARLVRADGGRQPRHPPLAAAPPGARTDDASSTFDYVVVGLGGLGSAAAWELARRGHRVLGLERFQLGHSHGASHDTSRILRHSYHTPAYVRLTQEAYADWARLERESGTALVTTTGGLDLFPPDPAIPSIDYTQSMDEVGIALRGAGRRPGDGALAAARGCRRGRWRCYQADAAIVPAGRTTAVLQDRARSLGAELREHSPVLGLRGPRGRPACG